MTPEEEIEILKESLEISKESQKLFKEAAVKCLPCSLVYELFCEHRFLLEFHGYKKKR